jgi:hypothetical protein
MKFYCRRGKYTFRHLIYTFVYILPSSRKD